MSGPIRTALVVGALQVAVALLATAAHTLGYIDQDGVIRVTMVAIGLAMLFHANATSKAVARSARSIAVHRFVGWSMALSALAWTAIWLFAPMAIANVVAMAAVGLGTLAAAAYSVRTPADTTP